MSTSDGTHWGPGSQPPWVATQQPTLITPSAGNPAPPPYQQGPQFPPQQFPPAQQLPPAQLLPPAPGGGSGGTVFGILALVVLLLGTGISYVVAHQSAPVRSLTPRAVPSFSLPSFSLPTLPSSVSTRPPAATPTYTPSSPTATLPETPTRPPTPDSTPWNSARYTAVLKQYFDGFLNHDTAAVVAATCPQYRSNVHGTYYGDNEVASWQSDSVQLDPTATSVDVYVAESLRNHNTGADAGQNNHTWVVERIASGNYYVCGYRD